MANFFSKFKDKHTGSRGFILATGPSLNDIDLSLLKDEITLGTNLAYKSGLSLNYSFLGDKKIASQFWQEIYHLPLTLFVSCGINKLYFEDRPKTYCFLGNRKNRFSTVAEIGQGRLFGGGTCTMLALQMAWYMGLSPVYLIGLDHYRSFNPTEKDIEDTGKRSNMGQPLVVSKGPDRFHFTEDYYGKGVEYYIPTEKTQKKLEESYRSARKIYMESNRKLYNASTKTGLSEKIIPRKKFKEII